MKSLMQTIISILSTITLLLSMLGITFGRTTKSMWNNAYDMTDQRYQVTYHEKTANTEKEVRYQRDGTTVHYTTDYIVAGVKITSIEHYYSKEETNYYNYKKNIVGAWTKEAVTEEQYNSAVSNNCVSDFKGVFNYEDFEYDEDTKYYKADKISHIVSDEQTDIYKDVIVKLVNNRIVSVNATQVDAIAVTKTLDVTYTSLSIILPVVG